MKARGERWILSRWKLKDRMCYSFVIGQYIEFVLCNHFVDHVGIDFHFLQSSNSASIISHHLPCLVESLCQWARINSTVCYHRMRTLTGIASPIAHLILVSYFIALAELRKVKYSFQLMLHPFITISLSAKVSVGLVLPEQCPRLWFIHASKLSTKKSLSATTYTTFFCLIQVRSLIKGAR